MTKRAADRNLAPVAAAKSALAPARTGLERAAIAFVAGQRHHALCFVSLAIEAAVTAAPFFGHDGDRLAAGLLQGLAAPWTTQLRPMLTQEIKQTVGLICAFGENAATLFALVERGGSLADELLTQAPILATLESPGHADTLAALVRCGGVHQRLKNVALLRHFERHYAAAVARRLQTIEAAFAEEGISVPVAVQRFGDAMTYLALGCWMDPQSMGRGGAFINAAAMLNAVKTYEAVLVQDGDDAQQAQLLGGAELVRQTLAPDSLVLEPIVIDAAGVTAYVIDVGDSIQSSGEEPSVNGEDVGERIRRAVHGKCGADARIEVMRARRHDEPDDATRRVLH